MRRPRPDMGCSAIEEEEEEEEEEGGEEEEEEEEEEKQTNYHLSLNSANVDMTGLSCFKQTKQTIFVCIAT
jgi:hypothetical protein